MEDTKYSNLADTYISKLHLEIPLFSFFPSHQQIIKGFERFTKHVYYISLFQLSSILEGR